MTLMGRNGMGKTTTIRSICGMTPARAGQYRFRRRAACRPAAVPHRAPRHRPGPGGTALLSQPDGPGKPRRLRPTGPVDARRRAGAVSAPRRASEPICQHAVGRRAADAGDRPRADDQSTPAHPRRGDRRAWRRSSAQDIWSAIRTLKADGQAILVVDKTMDEVLPRRRPLRRPGEGAHCLEWHTGTADRRPSGPLSRRVANPPAPAPDRRSGRRRPRCRPTA